MPTLNVIGAKGIYHHWDIERRVSIEGVFERDTREAMRRYYRFGLAPRTTTTLGYIFMALLKDWQIRNKKLSVMCEIAAYMSDGVPLDPNMRAGDARSAYGSEALKHLTFEVVVKES